VHGVKVRHDLFATEDIFDSQISNVPQSDVALHEFGNAPKHAQRYLGQLG
jgi:hypothetical protein